MKGKNYYVWDGNDPVPCDALLRLQNHECFVTGELIKENDTAYWTDGFDAWISERGYQMIQNAHSTGELNKEWDLIFGEWYTKDETISGREEMMFDSYDPDNP